MIVAGSDFVFADTFARQKTHVWDHGAVRNSGDTLLKGIFRESDPRQLSIESALREGKLHFDIRELTGDEIDTLCDYREWLKTRSLVDTSCPERILLGPKSLPDHDFEYHMDTLETQVEPLKKKVFEGALGRPSGQRPMFWNIWTERTESVSRTYKTMSHLEAGATHLLAIDLAALAYKGAQSRRTSTSFDKEVEKWLETDIKPEPIKLLLLLDPRFFIVAQTQVLSAGAPLNTRVVQMPIDIAKIRMLQKKEWPSTENAAQSISLRRSQEQAGLPSPDWLFGESTFRIMTRPGASGATTIGLSVWYRDRPIDEIVYSTCVLPAGSTETCRPVLNTSSLTGIDSLRVLASDGASPDVAVHFVELGDKIKGVVHIKGAQSDGFLDWTLSMNPMRFRNELKGIYLKPMGMAASERSLGDLALQFFDFLFPEKDIEDKENLARKALLKFVTPTLLGEPFPDNAKSIFVRMLQQGSDPPLVIPFGLLALELQDGMDPRKRHPKFLGSYFRIEAPLEFQDYQPPKQCIARWVAVLPPGDTGDDTLTAAKNESEETFRRWSKQEFFLSMNAFASWNREKELNQSGAAVVVLSHHAADKLYFYNMTSDKDSVLTPVGIKRRQSIPSIAILNGCGTAAPEGSNMLRKFNETEFMTIIATSTEVNGYMAGAFLKLFAQELAKGPKEGITISYAYFQTLKQLSQLRPPADQKTPGAGIGVAPYGALVLKYALLGNGALTLCTQGGGNQ